MFLASANANEQSSGRSKKWDDKVESNCCSAEIESRFASDNPRSRMFLHRLLMVKALQEMITLASRLPCHCECIYSIYPQLNRFLVHRSIYFSCYRNVIHGLKGLFNNHFLGIWWLKLVYSNCLLHVQDLIKY